MTLNIEKSLTYSKVKFWIELASLCLVKNEFDFRNLISYRQSVNLYLWIWYSQCCSYSVYSLNYKRAVTRDVLQFLFRDHKYISVHWLLQTLCALAKDFDKRGQHLVFFNLSTAISNIFQHIGCFQVTYCQNEVELEQVASERLPLGRHIIMIIMSF